MLDRVFSVYMLVLFINILKKFLLIEKLRLERKVNEGIKSEDGPVTLAGGWLAAAAEN